MRGVPAEGKEAIINTQSERENERMRRAYLGLGGGILALGTRHTRCHVQPFLTHEQNAKLPHAAMQVGRQGQQRLVRVLQPVVPGLAVALRLKQQPVDVQPKRRLQLEYVAVDQRRGQRRHGHGEWAPQGLPSQGQVHEGQGGIPQVVGALQHQGAVPLGQTAVGGCLG